MLHRNRIWSLSQVASPEELALKLTEVTWTGCTAFQLGMYLFANDATSPDGAQEYAVFRAFQQPDSLVQVESITFSWCSFANALELIQQIQANRFDSQLLARIPRNRFQNPEEHNICDLCL